MTALRRIFTATALVAMAGSTGPALTAFNDQLVMAYVANNGSLDVCVTTSKDGVTWTTGKAVAGQTTPMTPALSGFLGNVVLAYVANTGNQRLIVTTSADASNWQPGINVSGP